MKRVMMLVAVVGGMVQMAVGADTHDYSTYVQLKKSDVTVSGGYPAAANWNPATDMATTPDASYLIPAGYSLYTKSGSENPAGEWPCAELAVQGTFIINVGHGRQYAPTGLGVVALLPGSSLKGNSAYTTLNAESVDVRSTAASPVNVTYAYSSEKNNSYFMQIDAPLTSDDASAVIRFERISSFDSYDTLRAFRLTKGCANYLGTIVITGARTWLRDTGSTNFDIGGTLQLTGGGNLYIDTQSPTFGSFDVGSGSTVELVGGKTITVNGPMTIGSGAIVKVNKLSSVEFVFDDGSATPPALPEVLFLSVCGAENAAGVDRDNLRSAIVRGGVAFKSAPAFSEPLVTLVEKTRADGGVDFYVSQSPDLFVRQVKSCLANKGPYGFGMYEEYLSDKQPISPEKDYYSTANIYFSSTYTFPGRSLAVAGLIGFYSGDVFISDDLTFLKGSWFRQMNKDSKVYLRGKARMEGKLECRIHGTGTMFIESELSGPGDLIVAFDIDKYIEKKSTGLGGRIALSGANTAWTGRALVGCGRAVAEGSVGLTNLTLRVSAARNLGGGLDAFVFDSLKVADTCTIAVTGTTTFDAANRGWCLMDGSTVDVAEGKTVTANETVTFGGTVTKTGAGTLVLGGPSKAYDAENDAPVDTPNGAELVVAAGGLGATATDAFAGLSSLTFAAGTKYIVSAANASGADLSSVALTVPAGGVPIAFTDIPKDGSAITIATFATAEDAAKFTFEKPRGYIVTRSVEEVGGKFVLKAGIEKSGAVLILR